MAVMPPAPTCRFSGDMGSLMNRLLMVAASIALSGPALAMDDLERSQLAMDLGSVLASEEPCGLTYSSGAIEKFIDQKVPADDMGFPSELSMMTSGAEFQIKEMTPAAKTAHCRQIKRVAKSFGFTE